MNRSIFLAILTALFFASCKVYVPHYTTVPEMYNVKSGMSLEEVNSVLGVKPHEFYSSYEEGTMVVVYKYKKTLQKVNREAQDDPENLSNGGYEYFKHIGNLYALFDLNDKTLQSFVTTEGRKNTTKIINESYELIEVNDTPYEYVKKNKGSTTLEDNYTVREGYFAAGEVYYGSSMYGFKLFNGTSIGRTQYIALGLGVERLNPLNNGFGLNPTLVNSVDDLRTVTSEDYEGLYIPITVRYTADLKRKKFTPFVFGEAGYLLNTEVKKVYTINNQTVTAKRLGGPIVAAGFGLKYNTKKRVSFSLNAGLQMRSFWIKETFTEVVSSAPNSGWRLNMTPTIGLGIGF